MSGLPGYAELHCISHFTFLRGASSPEELVQEAVMLGYRALALTDECSLAGIVRAHVAARGQGLRLVSGSEFRCSDGMRLVLLAASRSGYAQLSALITTARRAAAKGQYRLERADLTQPLDGCLALWLPGRPVRQDELAFLAGCFPGRLWIAVALHRLGDDQQRLAMLAALGRSHGVPLLAAGDVHMHRRSRRMLQDTLTAIRLRTTVAAAGHRLYPNGERCLRPPRLLARLYPPELIDETVRLLERVEFSLDELRYEYPHELVPAGHTPDSWLTELVGQGMCRRWPGGAPEAVRRQIGHELGLIAELGYAAYFLTVHDIVSHARGRGILCQGRGSAANSAVCFCLGITEVDPARMSLLFERFISRERNEPPDIDVDFEHERREEVIQYIYAKYGRERAALAATVTTYRPRSAIRDVGRALGIDAAVIDRLARSIQWWDGQGISDAQLTGAGLDPEGLPARQLRHLAGELLGFPRHLSQHVGGFVISERPLSELVPVENAAMPGRTVIQWEKDDLEQMGLLKVDVLALGMLTAIRRCLDLVNAHEGSTLTLADIPAEDPRVYEMISRADTVGVFQIESRAQMAMLPRLKPRCFYDLVIEVAIVRPGPIQGEMVHPYLRRRSGLEPVSYPGEELRGVLERTLGVPIFQEQVMQLAIVAAGFSPGEADRLRRAMAAWKRSGGMRPFADRLIGGMRARGYSEAFARQIFHQIEGFGEYGFPESHAASFALLVYVSAWLKRYHPAAFTAALLNSQPMGFYAPAQLVQAARRQGVELRPVDVNASHRDCTLEPGREGPALRLGLCMVQGLSVLHAEQLVAARGDRSFTGPDELATRSRLPGAVLERLAAAGALASLAGHRHRARWRLAGRPAPLPLLPDSRFREGIPLLRAPSEAEDIHADYHATGLSLRRHPLALLRARLAERQLCSAAELYSRPDGAWLAAAGLVISRQRPGSAHGTVFVTLEDETGQVNVIVHPRLAGRQRGVLLQARLMAVTGHLQRRDGVLHLVAGELADFSEWLGQLRVESRDFR
ncbi:MAG: error-prone DNA polymerase [Chromatiales bacterium]|nr:error-prone DNA polymerase [Chromatiales bacterium]